jgi:hypothetical protein
MNPGPPKYHPIGEANCNATMELSQTRPAGSARRGFSWLACDDGLMESVKIERWGKMYVGYYRVDGNRLTVTTASGRRAEHLGKAPAEAMARVLLREMVEAGEA